MKKLALSIFAVSALILAGCSKADEAPAEPAAATQGGNVVKAPPGLETGPSGAGGGAPAGGSTGSAPTSSQ